METIALIGAGGQIGSQAMPHLVQAGRQIRAGSRSPEQKEAGERERWRYFDFEDLDIHEPFLRGVDRLFFLAAHPDPLPSVSAMLDQAEKLKLRQVVFSSGRTTGDVPGKPLHEVEERLKQTSIPWTILRPGWFMQNFTTFLRGPIMEHGLIMLPDGGKKTAFVDTRDIGAAIATILTDAPALHQGMTYEITGSEALTHLEVARLIGDASGREIGYRTLSETEFIREMKAMGWSGQAAEYTAMLYRFVAEGKEEEPSADLARLLGRTPISFKRFAEDYARHWKPS